MTNETNASWKWRIRLLGSSGGIDKKHLGTSFLINENLLIDGGSVAHALSIEEQLKIQQIFISHSHLDHICDLAFLFDNCCGQIKVPIELWAFPEIKKILRENLFNEWIWPDFSKIPSRENPTFHYREYLPEKRHYTKDGCLLIPVEVSHPGPGHGFIVAHEEKNEAIIFTLDTAPTSRIWEFAKSLPFRYLAVVTEVSFPNNMHEVAFQSFHHTPSSFLEEIKKMPHSIPIFVTHLKPSYREKIVSELQADSELYKRLVVVSSNDYLLPL